MQTGEISDLNLPGVDLGPSTPVGLRRGIEVARVAVVVAESVRCEHCALGIAIDIVGRRHGEGSHDWAGKSAGHVCKVTARGLGPEAAAVLSTLFGWTAKEAA